MRVELVYMQHNISEIFTILEMASLDTLCVNRHFGINSLHNLILLICLQKTNFFVQNKSNNNNNNNNNKNNNNNTNNNKSKNNKNCSHVLGDSKPGFALSLFLFFFTKTKAKQLFLQRCVEVFNKIIKFPHFSHFISIHWFTLKIRLCFNM